MRPTIFLAAAVLAAVPALARDADPYYGPKSGGFSEGFKDKVEQDGSWRIVAEYRSRDPLTALNVALYRAAELARQAKKPYVQILGSHTQSSVASSTGFVLARASDSPAAPPACRDKLCYTADVAEVLKLLSGQSGSQPGVPKSSTDRFGRQASVSGFGTGAVSWSQR